MGKELDSRMDEERDENYEERDREGNLEELMKADLEEKDHDWMYHGHAWLMISWLLTALAASLACTCGSCALFACWQFSRCPGRGQARDFMPPPVAAGTLWPRPADMASF